MERKLEMNFRLAQAWGCVLLLDEADVFLAQRTSSDLERNAVVSGKFHYQHYISRNLTEDL